MLVVFLLPLCHTICRFVHVFLWNHWQSECSASKCCNIATLRPTCGFILLVHIFNLRFHLFPFFFKIPSWPIFQMYLLVIQ